MLPWVMEERGAMEKPDLNKDHYSSCKPPPPRAGRRGCLVTLTLGSLIPTQNSHPSPPFMLCGISAAWEGGVERAFWEWR